MLVPKRFPEVVSLLAVVCLTLHLTANGGELTYGIGGGIIGDGDIFVTCAEFGARQDFFKYCNGETSLNFIFGERTQYIDESYSFPIDRKLPIFQQHYAIQSDISVGLAPPRLFALQAVFFGGVSPTYSSQIGAEYFVSVNKNVPGGLVAWECSYWKDNGFSLGYHYGIRLGFETRRFTYGIKTIYRTDGDNTWALALFEFGYKCFHISARRGEGGLR